MAWCSVKAQGQRDRPVREDVPRQTTTKIFYKAKIWPWVPNRGSKSRRNDWMSDWLSVVVWLWLWLPWPQPKLGHESQTDWLTDRQLQSNSGSYWRWRQHGPPKRWYPTTTLYVVIIQKNWTWIFTLKMEAACSSETFVSIHHITRRNNTEGHKLYLHHRENLRLLINLSFFIPALRRQFFPVEARV
jgi:hypothetical protein